MKDYEDMKATVLSLLAAGKLERTPTREQRIDFAYGNTKIENADVTQEMVVRAIDSQS